MVFLPLTRADVLALRDSGTAPPGEVVGHAATPSLLRSHGYDVATLEDAEYAALSYAGVHALTLAKADPLRLVLAAEVPPAQLSAVSDDPFGSVAVSELSWRDVHALFADEPAAAAAVARARTEVRGLRLAAASTLAAVEALLDNHDLLWYAPEELDLLP